MASLRKIEPASSAAVEEPSTELTLGIGSSFRSTTTDSDHRGKKISMNPAKEHRQVDMIVQDLTLDDDLPDKKKSTERGEGSGTHHGEGQAIPLASSPRRLQQEVMERRRINRLSAMRSRARKNEYVAELERQAKHLENKIAILHPQVVAYEHQRRLLLVEHHEVKYRMALLEKERLLKEVEAEKMQEEILRLLEFQRHQQQIRAEAMRSWGADMTLMCPSPAGASEPVMDSSSSVEVKDIGKIGFTVLISNGLKSLPLEEAKIVGPSNMEVDTANSDINKGKGKARA
ncbi:basic leucine zipper 34-like [Neltuma alba]|uniref:basic leucine zipper 34-like n=1 Tax=Neltuma alba TaxID=207710 RepID=UPI0010A54A8A|nr:basic leucine zipper 34-like [Prosopis alba]